MAESCGQAKLQFDALLGVRLNLTHEALKSSTISCGYRHCGMYHRERVLSRTDVDEPAPKVTVQPAPVVVPPPVPPSTPAP